MSYARAHEPDVGPGAWLWSAERHPALRNLLQRMALNHRTSAAILRQNGKEREAARIERFAQQLGLQLAEPDVAEQLRAHARALSNAQTREGVLEQALAGAMSITGADFGNVQVRNPETGALEIVCQEGFSAEFLEYFTKVDDSSSACGRAAEHASQTVIRDVERDAAFLPHRDIAASSGFRAVQSTPLIDGEGRVLGVVSTHFRRPHRPSRQELQLMAWYGLLVGEALEDNAAARKRTAARTKHAFVLDRAADFHEHAAERHDEVGSLYQRLAASERSRGNLEKAREFERRTSLYRERAETERARAANARRRGLTAAT